MSLRLMLLSGKRKKRKMIEILQEVIRSASLENASFENITLIDCPDAPKTEKEVTPFIRERVRLHHSSWIIEPLKEIVEELEREVSK